MDIKCVFCAIAKKQIPAKIVYEDEYSLAFLDVNPRSIGMSVVIPKQHMNEFDENFELSSKVLQSSLVVAEMLKQALQPNSVNLSLITSEAIQHFHIRIYPVYEDQIPLIENQPLKITEQELEEVARKIRSVKVEVEPQKKPEEKVEVKKEERKEEPMWSDEELAWMRREMEIS